MDDWQEWEEYVRYVYDILLNMKDDGVFVTRNAKIKGRSGAFHQIDVYYEFERAGIRHRVAIECKGAKRPVDKGEIGEFHSKLIDIGNLTGIVVSKNGFQEGARTVGEHYGIELQTKDDLPTWFQLFAERLKTVALPGESYVGEPFWTIMEIREGRVTGTYYAEIHPGTGRQHIPLFFCRLHAERAMQQGKLSPERWAIRGLPRFSLRAFIVSLELFEMRGHGAMIMFLPPEPVKDAPFISIIITRDQLMREYYGADVKSIKSMAGVS